MQMLEANRSGYQGAFCLDVSPTKVRNMAMLYNILITRLKGHQASDNNAGR